MPSELSETSKQLLQKLESAIGELNESIREARENDGAEATVEVETVLPTIHAVQELLISNDPELRERITSNPALPEMLELISEIQAKVQGRRISGAVQ